MTPRFSIRAAANADLKPIKKIILSALREYDVPIPDDYSLADMDDILSGKHNGRVIVLSKNHSVGGVIVLQPISKDCLELKRWYVSTPERGEGLGQCLLNHAIGLAREKNYKAIRLETTSKFKVAVALYRKHGFMEVPDAEKAPGHDLLFEKSI